MSGGHLAMAFDQSFLLALLLLIIGSGLLEGNISAQVGGLYPPTTRSGARAASRSSARGSISAPSPARCCAAFLGQRYGWHVGFGAAALFMLGALATYLSGYRSLAGKGRARRPQRWSGDDEDERKVVAALLGALAIMRLSRYIAYYQLANVLPIWLEQHADLAVGGLPSARFPGSSRSIRWFSILSLPLLFSLVELAGAAPPGANPSELDGRSPSDRSSAARRT